MRCIRVPSRTIARDHELPPRSRRRGDVHRPAAARQRDGAAVAGEDAQHAAGPVGRRDRGRPRLSARRRASTRRASARSCTARPSRRTRCSSGAAPGSGCWSAKGFRNILHLAEAWTPGPLFGFMVYDKPEPLVDRRGYPRGARAARRRTGARSAPLDEDAARAAVARAASTAASRRSPSRLLNAYANDRARARRRRAVAEDLAPGAADLPLRPTSCPSSASTSARSRRWSTPTSRQRSDRYLANLRDGLARCGARAALQVVRSDGGLMSLDAARERRRSTRSSRDPRAA